MKRALLAAAVLALVALLGPGRANATNECKGLDVCISVPGPWVAIPPAAPGGVRTVLYQVTCPKRSVAGGLDAVLGDPTLEVRFLGLLGSPVNPGISTARSVTFVATSARGHATAFRPVVGCVPTSGGGGRSTTAYTPVKPRPLLRRVRTTPVRGAGLHRVAAGCRASERLVGASYAVGFRSRLQPSAAVLSAVDVVLQRTAGRAVATVRRAAAVPSGLHVVVQVQLLCARGPR